MIIACLAVRLKSKRLHKKAFIKLKNKELFLHTFERASASKKIDKVIVCTSTNDEDTPIYDLCVSRGIECFRGEEDDVMKRFIDAVEHSNPNQIVRMTGDNPCISYEFIDLAIDAHLKNNAMYTTTEDLPRGMRSEIIDYKFLKNLHAKLSSPGMTEYMTWYLDRPAMWKVLKINVPKQLRRSSYRLTVDTVNDLALIEKLYNKLYKGSIISSFDIVKFLDENKSLLALNSEIKQRSYSELRSKVDIRLIEEL